MNNVPEYIWAKTELPSGCPICGKAEDLRTCDNCSAVSYCGRDHRNENRKAHRPLCHAIKNILNAFERYVAVLGPHPADASMPNISTLPERHHDPFLYRSNVVAQYYLKIYTIAAVRKVLAIRKFNMDFDENKYGAGGQVAAVWMRLDEDTQVYGFIKSWYLFEEDPSRSKNSIDPRGFSSPLLDDLVSDHEATEPTEPTPIENPDIFEPVDFYLDIETRFHDQTDHASFLISLTLLKIKVLLDLQDLQKAIDEGDPDLPHEEMNERLRNIPRSSAVKANPTIMSSRDHSQEISKLAGQVDGLYYKVHETNLYWWKILAQKPHEAIKLALERCKSSGYDHASIECGSPLEACAWFQNHQYCWSETRGAIEYIKKKNETSRIRTQEATERRYGARAVEVHPFCH